MQDKKGDLVVVNVIDHDRGGGAERLVGDLAEALAGETLTVRSIHFCPKPRETQSLGNVPRLYLDSIGRPLRSILRLRRALRDIGRSHHPVIVHAHLVRPLYWVPLATAGLDCILAYSEHSTQNRRRRVGLLRHIERLVYARYATIVCVSDAVRQSLVDWLGRRDGLVVIWNGARLLPLQQRAPLRDREIRFVSIGRLMPQKGFDRALRALSQITDIDWRYTIVGEGPDAGDLLRLANSLGIENRVTFAGWQDDVVRFLHEADIQLIPSRYDGFGLVAVEGMSTGIMVVASDVPGLRDVVVGEDSGGILVRDPDSCEAWQLAIRKAMNELEIRLEHHAAAARRQSERFSLTRCIEAHAALYRELAERFGACGTRSQPGRVGDTEPYSFF